jgi:hypothetical protein
VAYGLDNDVGDNDDDGGDDDGGDDDLQLLVFFLLLLCIDLHTTPPMVYRSGSRPAHIKPNPTAR